MVALKVAYPKILRCLGKAIADKGLKGLVHEIPYVGFVMEICTDAWNHYHEECQDEQISRAMAKELEQIARANPADLERQATQVAAEVLPGKPAAVKQALAGTLVLMQGQIRKTFTRKEDPNGKTCPASFVLRGPQDLASMIPARRPRFKAGDLLPNDPKWILVQRLDSGGFGEVWKAQNVNMKNRFAAVKFCLDPAAKEHLLKHEARVIDQVMQIKNDHIVKLEEVDFNPDTPWLRYEFIDGGNLLTSVRIPEDIERRAEWSRNMMLPLVHTMGACHLLKPPVVHRDLKPANILIDLLAAANGKGKSRVKITDFGISEILAQQALDKARRDTSRHASFATPTMVRGSYTEMYASPQQKAGLPTAPTDDVYALGVIWFQFLLGDFFLPLGRDYRDDLADLGLCASLIAVIEKCVADKPERRWANAKVLAEQIEKLPLDLLQPPAPEPVVAPVLGIPVDVDVVPILKPAPPEVEISAPKKKAAVEKPAAPTRRESLPKEKPTTISIPFALVALVLGFIAVLMLGTIRGWIDWSSQSAVGKKDDRSPALPVSNLTSPYYKNGPNILDCTGPIGADFVNVKAVQKAWADYLKVPAVETFDLGNNVKLEMILIPPGKFWMGSPAGEKERNANETLHEVELTRPYYVGRFPITQEQYTQVMQVANPSYFSASGPGRFDFLIEKGQAGPDTKSYPVESVTHFHAKAFCNALANQRRGEFNRFRLPTEAEWEYACRAGTRTPFHFGAVLTNTMAHFINYNTKDRTTCEVGRYPANAFGLYGMHGNVWEWCED